ncbi:hypothetical protein H6504_01660 [Candidatus Woesearchaeota archaeon]|nr:hypothetical protein [Candidatus Woesearchaeota archaeon]
MKQILALLLIFCLLPLTGAASYSTSKVLTFELVNQDPDPATAGDIVEVRIGIQNTGGEGVESLFIEAVPEYPFSLVSGEEAVKSVGPISGFQSDDNTKIVKFRLKVDETAPAGAHELKINYFEKTADVKAQKTFLLDIKNSESVEITHISESSLVPGIETEVKITLKNVGNAPLSNLEFTWVNDDDVVLPVGSSNTKYIEYLGIDQSSVVSYRVIADTNAEPGLYKLDMTLRYDDPISGTTDSDTTVAGMYVGGGTDFEVTFSEQSGNEISFSVANIGSNPAYSVTVSVPQQQGWQVSGARSSIIGNLNNGDYTVASYTLSKSNSTRSFPVGVNRDTSESDESSGDTLVDRDALRSTAQSSNTVKLEIAYTDTMGVRKTIEKEVLVETSSSSGSFQMSGMRNSSQTTTSTNYTPWIIGAVVAVVFFVGYRWFRRVPKRRK